MAGRIGRARLLAVLVGVLALVASPAVAHEQEQHPAPVTHQQPVDQTAASDDMPVASPTDELRWPTAEDTEAMAAHRDRPTTFTGRLVRWLGAWHPAVIHFPVALLLTVAFLELAAAVRGKPAYTASNKILLALAALGALVAAPLGWISAGAPEADDGFALTAHRWLGTATPLLLLALWALKRAPDQAPARGAPPYYEMLLAVMALVILMQAYFGAEVTHGAEHLAF